MFSPLLVAVLAIGGYLVYRETSKDKRSDAQKAADDLKAATSVGNPAAAAKALADLKALGASVNPDGSISDQGGAKIGWAGPPRMFGNGGGYGASLRSMVPSRSPGGFPGGGITPPGCNARTGAPPTWMPPGYSDPYPSYPIYPSPGAPSTPALPPAGGGGSGMPSGVVDAGSTGSVSYSMPTPGPSGAVSYSAPAGSAAPSPIYTPGYGSYGFDAPAVGSGSSGYGAFGVIKGMIQNRAPIARR